MEFKCHGCGLCCYKVDFIKDKIYMYSEDVRKMVEEFPYKTRDDGSCEKLDLKTMQCTVYDNRPDMCSVDKSWERTMPDVPIDHMHDLQYKSCRNLMIKDGYTPEEIEEVYKPLLEGTKFMESVKIEVQSKAKQPVQYMDIGEAIVQLKLGAKVKRENWGQSYLQYKKSLNSKLAFIQYIRNDFVSHWSPSQQDILTEDWVINNGNYKTSQSEVIRMSDDQVLEKFNNNDIDVMKNKYESEGLLYVMKNGDLLVFDTKNDLI